MKLKNLITLLLVVPALLFADNKTVVVDSTTNVLKNPTAAQLYGANIVPVAGGGTGATTLTGYLKGAGTSALTASATIPFTDITGTVPVAQGGTGATTLTGYLKGNGTSAVTASATVPSSDITGLGTMSAQNASAVAITGGTITSITDLAVADGGTGASTLTGYVKGAGTSAFTASSTIPLTDISGYTDIQTSEPVYVSPTGNDANAGTRTNPKASLQSALSALNNSGKIIMLAGDYTIPSNATLNMANAKKIKICSEPGTLVRVFLGVPVSGGSFSLASGIRYTATVPAISGWVFTDRSTGGGDSLCWIYEEGTKDGIVVNPMPQQKRKTHRMDDAKMWTQTGTAGVEAGAGRYFVSGTTLSVSSKDGVAPTAHTYWIPSQAANSSLVYGGTAKTEVAIEGISVYYGSNNLDFTGCQKAEVKDCVLVGAFVENILGTTGTILVSQTELSAAGNDNIGITNNTSKWSYILEEDIWSHDAGDEGSSMHQNIYVTRIGGLYEECSDGLTDAIGAQFSLYNIITRRNGWQANGESTPGGGGIVTGVSPEVNGFIYGWTSDNDYIALYAAAAGSQKTLTALTAVGSTVTATTSVAHGYYIGQKVSIDNVTTSAYNIQNVAIASIPSTTQFTYVVTGSPTTPGTVGSGRVLPNALVTAVNSTIINPDSTKWAFGAGTGCTVNVFNARLIGVTNKTAGAGTVNLSEGNFSTPFPLTPSSISMTQTATSGTFFSLTIPNAANRQALKLFDSGLTQMYAGYDSSANSELSSTRALILKCGNSYSVSFTTGVGTVASFTDSGLITTRIGTTLGIKSGTNAKAGTFTLTAGAATISNTSVTANSVIVFSLKTVGGTIAADPYMDTQTPSTGFTVAGGGALNTSTYNYIILEVN